LFVHGAFKTDRCSPDETGFSSEFLTALCNDQKNETVQKRVLSGGSCNNAVSIFFSAAIARSLSAIFFFLLIFSQH